MKRNASALQDAAVPRPGARSRPQKRAEQQRAVNTRRAILNAALAEFAEKGFDAASIRVIADRTGLQHPLITYHSATRIFYGVLPPNMPSNRSARSGTSLTRPVSGCRHLTDCARNIGRCSNTPSPCRNSIVSCVRECTTNNPRLKWVAKTVVMPLIDRLLPQIAALQKKRVLPQMEPILFHYMMVSLTAVLSEFGPEMRITSKLAADDPGVVASYWRGVEKMVFGKSPPDANIDAFTPRRSG